MVTLYNVINDLTMYAHQQRFSDFYSLKKHIIYTMCIQCVYIYIYIWAYTHTHVYTNSIHMLTTLNSTCKVMHLADTSVQPNFNVWPVAKG